MDPVNVSAKFEVRSFTRSWENRVPGYARAPLSPIFLIGFCSHRPSECNCMPNLNFVALPVFEKLGGTQKIWAVRGYAHAPLAPKFFMGLCSDGPCECINHICSTYTIASVGYDTFKLYHDTDTYFTLLILDTMLILIVDE